MSKHPLPNPIIDDLYRTRRKTHWYEWKKMNKPIYICVCNLRFNDGEVSPNDERIEVRANNVRDALDALERHASTYRVTIERVIAVYPQP